LVRWKDETRAAPKDLTKAFVKVALTVELMVQWLVDKKVE
jgi:hypothetical protein